MVCSASEGYENCSYGTGRTIAEQKIREYCEGWVAKLQDEVGGILTKDLSGGNLMIKIFIQNQVRRWNFTTGVSVVVGGHDQYPLGARVVLVAGATILLRAHTA